MGEDEYFEVGQVRFLWAGPESVLKPNQALGMACVCM
jgi:hypothetical protein